MASPELGTLQRYLHDTLTGAARLDIRRLLLIGAPLVLPAEVRVRPMTLPREISRREPSRLYLSHWPAAGLEAIRFPYLGFILEGEADLRLGVTPELTGEDNVDDVTASGCIVYLPAHTFFLIPPGVPYADGSTPHWERPNWSEAYSAILWLQIFPSGAVCHTCTTRGSKHDVSPAVFVQDAQLAGLVEIMLDELNRREEGAEPVAPLLLKALFLRLAHGLSRMTELPPHDTLRPPLTDRAPRPSRQQLAPSGLQRALHYIATHLAEPLSVPVIARHSYVSASQLKRLFRAELNTTIMTYVTRCRLETAQALLRDTDLPVQRIATMVGYNYLSHFSRAFTAEMKMSPLEYRKNGRIV